jgi:hypothetical protein
MPPMMKAPREMFAAESCTRNQANFSKTKTSDDGAEGNSHAPTCNPERACNRLTCGQRTREGRSLPWSGRSKATVSTAPPNGVCPSFVGSSAAFNSATAGSASSATTISSTLSFLYEYLVPPT